MKRFLVFLCLSLVISMVVFQPVVARGRDLDRDARWHEDVGFLWQQIQAIHPDPFRVTSQQSFAQRVSDLDAQIPNLSDEQVVVRLFALVASLRDGHSSIWFTENTYPFHYYPLMFYPFSDGLYLILAAPEYADLVGAKLLKIGMTDIAQVIETLHPLEPRDNDSSGLVTLPMLLSMSDALLGTGLISTADQPAYLLELPDGTQTTLNPAPVGQADYHAAVPISWRLPISDSLLSLSKADQAFWWKSLDDQTLYIQYNQVVSRDAQSGKTLAAFAHDLGDALTTTPVKRVILDLRYNGGGDINTARPLRSFFSGNDWFKTPGNLIVLTGRNTFSAATVFSLWLEHDMNPVFMGEPTGGRPLMFENAREITLPNSHLHGQIATRARHDFPGSDTRQTIEPQVPVMLSSADYFNDVDPVLAVALAYTAS